MSINLNHVTNDISTVGGPLTVNGVVVPAANALTVDMQAGISTTPAFMAPKDIKDAIQALSQSPLAAMHANALLF